MSFVKYLVAGLLLIGLALSLQVSIPTQLVTVSRGQVADFPVTIMNLDAGQNVLVSVDSPAPVSVSQNAFFLGQFNTTTINVFAVTATLGEGVYPITLTINGVPYDLAVYVKETSPILRFNAVFDTVEVSQGGFQDLKFLVRNEGQERLRNIVIEGDVPVSLNPQYPRPLDLAPNEMKQISIRITVPKDYPIDDYDFEIKAGAGNLIAKSNVVAKITARESLQDKLLLDVLLPWEALKDNKTGNIIGYELTFRITNRGLSDIGNVNFIWIGMPDDWEVSGDQPFSIQGFETKDLVLDITPKDFNDHEINLTLSKDMQTLANASILFSGYKVGTSTGLVVLGGDALIGILVVIIIAIIIVYVRRRSGEEEKKEEVETKSYLEDLVQKAREQEMGKEPEEDTTTVEEVEEPEEFEEPVVEEGKKGKPKPRGRRRGRRR